MVLYVVDVVASRLVQVIEFPKSLAMLSRSTFLWQRWNFWDSYPAFPQNCFDFPTDVDTSESAKDLMKRLICSAEVSSSSNLYFATLWITIFIFSMSFPLSSSLKSLNDNHLWNPGAVGSERDHGLQVAPLLRRRRLGQHHPVNCSLYTRGIQLTKC